MWIFTALSDGFSVSVHDWRLQFFRIVIGAAVLSKTLISICCGDWNRLVEGSFGRFAMAERHGARRACLVAQTHKYALVLRCVLSIFLLMGVMPSACCLGLALLLYLELIWEYRFNTVYLMLCLVATASGQHLSGWAPVGSTNSNTFSQFILVLLSIDLYWNSAWCKLRSEQFTSGLLLRQVFVGAQTLRGRMPRWEYWHPRVIARLASKDSLSGGWKSISYGAIALEVSIPVGLAFKPTWLAALIVGVLMHACFLMLLPLRLFPFQIAALGSYWLYMK